MNWRVIDKHLRKVMREMPPSAQGLSEYANDQQFLQAARSALGDAESADALFNAAIVALLFDARLQRELGTESPAWSWISRHARIQNASEHVPAGGTAAYQLVVDFCIELGLHEGDIDGPPRMMDQDLALVYERERRQPLPRCMTAGEVLLRRLLREGHPAARHGARRRRVPALLLLALRGVRRGRRRPRLRRPLRAGPRPLAFLRVESVAAMVSASRARRRGGSQASVGVASTSRARRRWRARRLTSKSRGAATDLESTTHTGPLRSQGRADNLYARFMTACIDCQDLIRTDARLAANVALHARLADQRRWIRTVDRDRMVARRKLREGGRAHAEFWRRRTRGTRSRPARKDGRLRQQVAVSPPLPRGKSTGVLPSPSTSSSRRLRLLDG